MPARETAVVEPRASEAAGHRRTRPLTEYWDYRTASWRTRDPIPVPRRGD
jgi:hypothetical protein